MRIALLTLLWFIPGLVMAQANDWARVQSLPPGTRIIIATHRRFPCIVNDVSEDGIDCVSSAYIRFIDRIRIDEVHLSSTGKGVIVATAVGAATGGLLASRKSDTGGEYKGVVVLAGASLGGFVGFIVGHLFGPVDGQLIYRKP